MQGDVCGWFTILILGGLALTVLDNMAGNICRVMLARKREKVAAEEKKDAQ